jgi:hypothetical protein
MTTARAIRFAFAVAIVLTSASTTFAQALDSDTAVTETAFAFASSNYPLPGAPLSDEAQPARSSFRFDASSKRPALLLPLYVSASALQVMDVVTTYRGMKLGAHETNPLVRNGNVGTTLALKAATTGVGIAVAEKMWKKHKAAAIAAMIATNVVTASIVAHNYRVINAQRTR